MIAKRKQGMGVQLRPIWAPGILCLAADKGDEMKTFPAIEKAVGCLLAVSLVFLLSGCPAPKPNLPLAGPMFVNFDPQLSSCGPAANPSTGTFVSSTQGFTVVVIQDYPTNLVVTDSLQTTPLAQNPAANQTKGLEYYNWTVDSVAPFVPYEHSTLTINTNTAGLNAAAVHQYSITETYQNSTSSALNFNVVFQANAGLTNTGLIGAVKGCFVPNSPGSPTASSSAAGQVSMSWSPVAWNQPTTNPACACSEADNYDIQFSSSSDFSSGVWNPSANANTAPNAIPISAVWVPNAGPYVSLPMTGPSGLWSGTQCEVSKPFGSCSNPPPAPVWTGPVPLTALWTVGSTSATTNSNEAIIPSSAAPITSAGSQLFWRIRSEYYTAFSPWSGLPTPPAVTGFTPPSSPFQLSPPQPPAAAPGILGITANFTNVPIANSKEAGGVFPYAGTITFSGALPPGSPSGHGATSLSQSFTISTINVSASSLPSPPMGCGTVTGFVNFSGLAPGTWTIGATFTSGTGETPSSATAPQQLVTVSAGSASSPILQESAGGCP